MGLRGLELVVGCVVEDGERVEECVSMVEEGEGRKEKLVIL